MPKLSPFARGVIMGTMLGSFLVFFIFLEVLYRAADDASNKAAELRATGTQLTICKATNQQWQAAFENAKVQIANREEWWENEIQRQTTALRAETPAQPQPPDAAGLLSFVLKLLTK